jgi:hypothetical protein
MTEPTTASSLALDLTLNDAKLERRWPRPATVP